MRPCGVAAERGARRDVPEHRALGRDPRSVIDQEVVRDAHVARQDDVVPDVGAARDPDAGHQQAALADPDIVPHVHQVVELGAAPDDGVVHAPAVDAGVGTDLHLVRHDAAAHVGNPVVTRGTPPVPEARAADDRTGLDHHSAADPRLGVAHGTGADHGVLADGHPVAERHALRQPGPRPQPDVPPQHHERADADVGTEHASGAKARGGIHAGRDGGWGKEGGHHAHQRRIRVRDHDARAPALGCHGQCVRYQHGAGPGAPERLGVARRDGQRERLGARPVERAHGADRHGPIAKQAATDEIGDRLRGETCRGHVASCPT